jgi:hypothetical protein
LLGSIAGKWGVCLGVSHDGAVTNIELIKSLEVTRNSLIVQSLKKGDDPHKNMDVLSDVDKYIHEDSVDELEDVMVL